MSISNMFSYISQKILSLEWLSIEAMESSAYPLNNSLFQTFASHYMTLLVDQEAFSISLYVCNTEGSHINCLFFFSVLGLTLRPCPIKNNYRWL